MRLQEMIRASKTVVDHGKWRHGNIPRADFPLKKKPVPLNPEWQWRVVQLKSEVGKMRVLLRLHQGKAQFYAVLADEREEGLALVCSHEIHTSHGDWHCHLPKGKASDVACGYWRDKHQVRPWPQYKGPTRVAFDVTPISAMAIAAKLYRFDLAPQSEMVI